MPEGHKIHRMAADHRRDFVGQELISLSPQGRFSREAREINGGQLRSVEAFGKHLFYRFSTDQIVHIHLGLYGKYRHYSNPAPEPRGAVRWRVIGDSQSFDLVGPNCCELIDSHQEQLIVDRLGADPIRDDADPQLAWSKIKNRRTPIGALLLDQSVIAGLGNIYRSEILFLCGINPQTPSNLLSEDQFLEVWKWSVDLMQVGVRENRIITKWGPRSKKPQRDFHVYKKPFCGKCEDWIYYWELGNRTVYACETCQRLDSPQGVHL